VRSLAALARRTFHNFQRHRGPWLAAAISYYMIFAIAPLIIVTVHIAGLILGHHRAVLDEIFGYIQSTAGQATADTVRSIVTTTFTKERSNLLTQTIGWVIFIVATLGLFAALQDALNIVWDLKPDRRSPLQLVRSRTLAFATVLVLALLLTLSIAVNAALTVAGAAAAPMIASFPILTKALYFVLSFAIMAGLLAFAFRFMPECHVEWRDVWVGSAVTSLLFVIGQFALGAILAHAALTSTFGAFTSLVLFLLWTNYSAQIILFGAEFTHVRAQLRATQEE
jgi:membrane protein